VPAFLPPPLVIYVPVPVPVPVPVDGLGPGPWSDAPPPTYPVLMSPQTAPFVPAVQNTILPALTQVLPPDQLQDTPLQVLPADPAASVPSAFVLAHPLLFCDVDSADTCEDLADQLDAITPGFDTAVVDGPNGYGVYLTYEPDGPALDDALATAPVQEIQLDDGSSVQVQVVLYCDTDASSTCEDLADQLADIDPNFGTLAMDGPQGYGTYLAYLQTE
jgi:hypothetical protein